MKKSEKNFKELEIILSSFECDKNCPYCTAKITKWDSVEDNIDLLELNVGQLKKLGYTFHYVTIGGNGEPTKHSYAKLKNLVEMFDDYDIPVKRVLTSGNVFRPENKDKLDLFNSHGWLFECTTTSLDNDEDRRILGYNHNYFETEAFKNSRVRLNYVLLESNKHKFIDEIKGFSEKYNNIETVAVKLLNRNTRTDLADNPLSIWIEDNAVKKDNREKIKDILDANFKYKGEAFDTFSWETASGKEVYFSWKKSEYGLYDLVWYGDKFVNYQLEEVDLSILPKVYIGAKFNKDKDSSFKNDFRVSLIGAEEKFINYNNESYITDLDDNLKYQYLGPFYNEKASSGDLTSTICDEVVQSERKLIENCDTFIVYLDLEFSPGSIAELTYAATLNKNILIIYKSENNIKYELKSSNWFPITMAKQLATNVKLIQINSEDEITKIIKSI